LYRPKSERVEGLVSEVLGDVEFKDTLMAWALRDGQTIEEHREKWQRLIDAIIAAGITGCVQVCVFPDDIATMFVLGQRPLQSVSTNLLGDYSGYESASFARSLVEPVDGPFMAVGRTGAGPITVVDGLHKMAAWAGHAEAGRGYPLVVNVVLTERPVAGFELLHV
jgi:hypothetical protein